MLFRSVQQLSAISMNLEYMQKLIKIDSDAAYEEVNTIQELVLKAAKDARLVLFELRPVILETQGLIPALERYVEQLNEGESVKVEAELAPLPGEISKTIAGTIFSIIQEAVNNVKRHAQATVIKIVVTTKGEHLLIHIKDNGTGFDLTGVEAGYEERNSFGLLNMKERAELIDGILAINSDIDNPVQGTTVTLSVPLKPGTGPLKRSLLTVTNYEEK